MKTITFGGLALILAALFGMVQLGAPAAYALPTRSTQQKKQKKSKTKIIHRKYKIRGLPGLTAPGPGAAKEKAKKRAEKLEKSTLQNQSFIGTIAQQNGHYVLTAGMFTFKLTDQGQAKKYKGKKVRITGKLNPQTNKINVHQIQKVSS